MQDIFKFSCLSFIAAAMTAVLFIGMLSLLKNQHSISDSNALDFRISYINPDDDLALKKRIKKKPLKKPKSSQAPAITRLKITENKNTLNSSADKFNYGYDLKAFEYNPLTGPNFNLGKLNTDSTGGVKAGIPPIYPPAALFRDKEGWVEVLISVNEMGLVSDVTVINAEPADLFNDAAINAVKKWAFYPKTVNGIPLPYQLTQTIEFKIDQATE